MTVAVATSRSIPETENATAVRSTALIAAALVVLASLGAGVAAYRWSRDSVSRLPEISAYSRGETIDIEVGFFQILFDGLSCLL